MGDIRIGWPFYGSFTPAPKILLSNPRRSPEIEDVLDASSRTSQGDQKGETPLFVQLGLRPKEET
jgi:hypothetical protein